jgi:hypothetical protein
VDLWGREHDHHIVKIVKIVLTKIDGITSVAQFATDFREQNGGLPGLKQRRKMS